jgi:hypothetical protein
MKMKKIKVNVKKLVKEKYIELIYLNNNDNIEYYDILVIINTQKNTIKFIPIYLLSKKDKKTIDKMRYNNELNVLSTNWYWKYKNFTSDYIKIMMNSLNYYPDIEISFNQNDNCYKPI